MNSDPPKLEWVSLRCNLAFKLFNTDSQSNNSFKDTFFYVVPRNQAAKEIVCFYDADKMKSLKFPFNWTSAHFDIPIRVYSRDANRLDEEDTKSLFIICD